MCGIAGFTGRAEPGLLARMTGRIRHRGPDGDGHASYGPAGGAPVVHLGHRRLAVIDVEGGRQPMDAAGRSGRTIAVTFNGEIYDFAAHRAALEADGVRFTTRSDTEVLLHALDRAGDAVLARLDGMFAFAWYDAAANELLLAVDRFGQKPLVTCTTPDGAFVFASELTALRAHPGVPQRHDPLALVRMLAFDAPPAPQTALRGVARMEPGTAMRVRLDGEGRVVASRTWRWYEPSFGGPSARAPSDEEFAAALGASVRSHLVSDVPLGILLSGGLDSTAVAWAASRERRVVTLSLRFGEGEFDESSVARATAAALGTEHREIELHPAAAAETLLKVAAHLDEPLADASAVATWELFRATRGAVTVAVGGDGADELLEGYPTFRALEIARRNGWAGTAAAQAVLRPLARAWPVGEGYYPLGYKLRRFVDGQRAAWWHRPVVYVGGCGPDLLRAVVRPETLRDAGLPTEPRAFAGALYEPACPPSLRDAARSLAPDDFAVWAHLRNYLAGEVLRKVDRTSMAHGLEVRAPLLGAEFSRVCLAAPSRARRSRGRTKLPLRRLLASSPAAHVAALPKRGFAIPVSRWLRTELRPIADDVFLAADSPLLAWCDGAALARLWTRHRDGRDDARRELWALLSLGLWLRSEGGRAPG